MPKTIRNVFDSKLTFEHFLSAHERAKEGKMNRYEVLKFELNLEVNIVNLIEKIKNNTYELGTYRVFTVYEPKERIIKALPYVDRVVHQWYVEEFIKPIFVPKFISDTYACIEKRGTHIAVNQLEKYVKHAKKQFGSCYVLKLDIKKFFYSIDHTILLDILNQSIKDRKLLNFTRKILYLKDETVGIPIGNYTSQFYANIYLYPLDLFIKQELNIKYYVRYMDDFILLVQNKKIAKEIMARISLFLWGKLRLKLNPKSGCYPYRKGINFCGYIIYSNHRMIRYRSVLKMKKQIKIWNKLYHNHCFKRENYILSFHSWIGHIKHANSYQLKRKMLERMIFLNDDVDNISIKK